MHSCKISRTRSYSQKRVVSADVSEDRLESHLSRFVDGPSRVSMVREASKAEQPVKGQAGVEPVEKGLERRRLPTSRLSRQQDAWRNKNRICSLTCGGWLGATIFLLGGIPQK